MSIEFFSDVFKLENQIYLCVPKVGKIIIRLTNILQKKTHSFLLQACIQNRKTVSLLKILLGDVFNTVLSIYHADAKQTLPKPDEVLLCTEDTSICEVKYNIDVEAKKDLCDFKINL